MVGNTAHLRAVLAGAGGDVVRVCVVAREPVDAGDHAAHLLRRRLDVMERAPRTGA